MKTPWLALPALVLLTACHRPEVEAFRQNPAPVYLTLVLPSNLPNAQEIRQDYGAALRARLATRVTVVPEDVAPPPGAAELVVYISRVDAGRHGDPSPAVVGVTTGVAVGVLSSASGNRYGVLDGLFWGLWTGSHVAAHRDHEARRLGYYPSRINAVVTLRQPGTPTPDARPLVEFDVDGHRVIDAMDPLRRADTDDPARVREEEARAFARVVVGSLQERFNWATRSTPAWYRAPESLPAPAPRPPDAPSAEAPKPEPPKG